MARFDNTDLEDHSLPVLLHTNREGGMVVAPPFQCAEHKDRPVACQQKQTGFCPLTHCQVTKTPLPPPHQPYAPLMGHVFLVPIRSLMLQAPRLMVSPFKASFERGKQWGNNNNQRSEVLPDGMEGKEMSY